MTICKRKIYIQSLLVTGILGILLLTGCTQSTLGQKDRPGSGDSVSDGYQNEGSKADKTPEETTSKEAGEQVSHIGTDPAGYAMEDVKEALFWGEGLADTFWIVEADTGHRVYKGSLQPYENCSVSENSLWIGSFSDLTNAGDYYIETPVIGQSEIFSVKKEPAYNGAALVKLWKEQLTQKPDAKSLFLMGITAELYPEENEALLQTLTDNAEALTRDMAEPGEDPEPLSEQICMLAQIASLTQTEQSEELTKNAKDGFETLQKLAGDGSEHEKALQAAAAGLFKLTGDRRYAESAEAFLTRQSSITEENFPALWFYLTAGSEVDTDLCDRLIRKLITRCSRITEQMEQEAIPYALTDEDLEEKLFEVRLLSLGDYILVSKEYETAKNRRLHRLSLSGMAPKAIQDPQLLAELYLAGF